MSELDFILQAVTAANHADAIRAMLRLAKPNRILISVAFVREAGLDALETTIKPLAKHTKFFVGIRNDITSVQAIKRLLSMKVALYAVDTGSRNTIFHPKLYLITNDKQAQVIIGSANLTLGGLHNNIEASTLIKLDLSNATHKKFTDNAITSFEDMLKNHPKHVFQINNEKHADELFESGRLADEDLIPAPTTNNLVKKGKRDDLSPMKLHRVVRARIKPPPAKPTAATRPAPRAKAAAPIAPALAVRATGYYLVWESKRLTERDLNIPKAAGTNPTGSMGLKKGAFDNIDHRHYFREEIFADLVWKPDAPPSKWERAQANFALVIKNLNYETFDLRLSHNTDTKSATYRQKNFMTQLHWGTAREHVAKRDLLDRILYLYRKDTNPPEFMIEID